MISLPIDEVLPALRLALSERHEAVLEAPPGAGKTTRVPLKDVAGKLKTVEPDCPMIKEAKTMGISFGD